MLPVALVLWAFISASIGESPTQQTLGKSIGDIVGLDSNSIEALPSQSTTTGSTPQNEPTHSEFLLRPCNRSRELIKDSSWGRISDGPSNYTQDTTCEWLISAPEGHWITLKIDRVRTECSYDYLFVVDGISYSSGKSKLIASFSGASDPRVNILAESGHMLILLYSDPNYVLDGFEAEYSISPCPLNCSLAGECVQNQKNEHVCKCIESRGGVACQFRHATPTISINLSNSSSSNETNANNKSVLAKNLPSQQNEEDEDDDDRVILAAGWNSPLARVGHSAVHLDKSRVTIYGGYDLNKVLDSLVTYDLKSGAVEILGNGTIALWPGGRYAHGFVQSGHGFFIHGGKTQSGKISNDLFYYNATSAEWNQFSDNGLPSLMYHSMTRIPSGWIYVYGGGTPEGEFSSKMYRFHESSQRNWTVVKSSCCGKSTLRSVLGHSMTFWPSKNALILFGGLGSSDFGRFSKLSSQLWLFLLDSNTWLQLDYKKNGALPTGIGENRAFHTAHLADHYLTIFGGYTHVHNKDESCYSHQMLVYNLECQIFLPSAPPPPTPTQGGFFGHQSVIFKDKVLILGGYRGYLSQKVGRISFPFSKSRSAEDCSSFDRWRCSGEPKCGWCPTNLKCFDKLTGAVNCTTNLQTVQCPGMCPLLSSCQSCAVPGCIWCGSSEQCWKESESATRHCSNSREEVVSTQGNGGECTKKSYRMGATQFEYRFPPNFTNPDNVKIINSSVLIIPREYGSSVGSDKPTTFALRGSLVAISKLPFKKLELCALQAAVNLSLFGPEETLTASYRWSDYQLCYNLTWPSGHSVILMPGTIIRFELMATSFGKGVSQEKFGKVTIQQKFYSGPIPSPRLLVKGGLIPYDSSSDPNVSCNSYKFCLPCTGDVSCAWNQNLRKCSKRTEFGKSKNSTLTAVLIQPEDCSTCSDINFCEDCISSRDHGVELDCEWWEEEMSCQRRGRQENAVRDMNNCPASCASRNNCSSCLDGPGKCVWCEQRQECFVFSTYTSSYQYGQCFQWIDKGEMCNKCDRQSTCESCILNIGCGWSYNENGGSCSEGDFGGQYRQTLLESTTPELLLQDGNNKTWIYGECPDVNECDLGIDDCHSNATCVNTPGSFRCLCLQGFTGDGRSNCDQTCYEPCIHGTCSPLFVCECDLGWTGVDCSVDCGCNNHSFCETGKCDECKDFTTGEHCEFCAEGSYGNATQMGMGCSACNCNGHGDPQLGLCDPGTGHCFCLNNTAGKYCDECKLGFYGESTDGKPCYQSCSGRALMEAPKGSFGLPPEVTSSFLFRRRQLLLARNSSTLSNIHIEHCMWIIRGNSRQKSNNDDISSSSEQEDPAGLNILIEPGFDIPCSQNVLMIYSGYSEFGLSGIPLISAICNEKEENKHKSSRGIRIIVNGNVATVVLKYARMGSTKFSFNANFQILQTSEELDSTLNSKVSPPSENNLSLNISRIYEGPSLSVLSRYGHSLHLDKKNIWIFGGFSLSHGPLNDIRHFSLESNSWVPLTITVVQNDETASPLARYFHAGVLGQHLEIFIHGGISANLSFLSDSWKFDTRHSRWSKFCEGPNQSPKLAGHTMTLRSGAVYGDPFSIVILGGFNPEEGFSDKVYTISGGTGSNECWTELETSGSLPVGVYGHSTVYNEDSDTFYLFGGTLHDTIGTHHVSISTSKRLFALHWPSKRWSVLAPLDDNQIGYLPNPRFLHTAVSTPNYMVVLGGIIEGNSSGKEKHSAASSSSSLLVYVYQCNLWLIVQPQQQQNKEGNEGVDRSVSRVASTIGIWNNEIFQMGGWHQGSTSESLFLFQIPRDPCGFHRSKQRCKGTVGCAFCSSNNNRTQQCYNAREDMPSSCSSGASNIEFWKGTPCSSLWMSQQGCSRFNSCTECLSMWPSHPNITQGCQWCTNGKEGRCVQLRKKFEEDSPCGQKQWVITESSQCPERICSAPQCERCTATGTGSKDTKCIYTRQILRSRERSWEMRLQPVYDWNCVRKSILDTSPSVSVVSSPPAACPIPCQDFDSCQECLESPGAEGGFHQCYWSVGQHKCISPAYSPLLCFGGNCGPILKGSPALCPKACSTLRSCNSCLENPSCGWCAVEGENGEGLCLPATNSQLESNQQQCSNRSKWHYLKCPRENECLNGHHACDAKSEQCIDLEDGYRCQCREGYERSDTSCMPICPDGCVHGVCKEPGVCACNFGFVGGNCSLQCDCNGHSNCAGVNQLDVCLECQNNTMGPKCSQCKPMYVGDPRNNGACIACIDYCNGHSNICLSYGDYNKWCNGTNKHLTSTQLLSRILSSGVQMGPSTTAFCCHCKNQTSGDTCNDCNQGFFRGYDDKRLACRPCECQGHGDTCDPVTGQSCNCHNNTESEHCSQNAVLKQACYKHQCSKCKDSYLGNPAKIGHQCYLQLLVDSFYCFDPKSQDKKCAMKQKPLLSGRTVFFAVQPKFMNVNIRVTLDVTVGSINVYLSPKEDTFVIKQDEHNWIHRVEFDTKYGLTGERKEINAFSKASFGGESNKIDSVGDYEIPSSNKTDDEDGSGGVGGVSRIIPKPVGASSSDSYRFTEHEAAGYATYYTVQDPKAILLVKNLRNRLVITLPQDNHDLRLTRFYIVLEGIGDLSYGSVFFRQDQLHIDLFVFFSVFFSAFFLFLAGCGVAWKVKQNIEVRRTRQRHMHEMLSMAKRPFAMWTILLEPDANSGIAEAYSQCRKSCRKGCICLRPLAVEWTSGSGGNNSSSAGVFTMLISMPGGNNAPVRLSIGSVLANLQRSSHVPYHGRRRRLQH